MIIGGVDHVLPRKTSPWALDLLLRGLRTKWPQGVVIEGENRVPLKTLPFPYPRETAEIFVFEFPGSASFLQLIKRDQDFTIVSDEMSDSLAKELLNAIRFNPGFAR